MKKIQYEIKTIVLKSKMDGEDAEEIIDKKKTSLFRSMLRKPKKEEVHVHSIKLFYESFLIISGTYKADFFRKATHRISVDSNVSEVVFGEGIFPVNPKTGVFKKFGSGGGKNHIDLDLEEHVFISEEDQMVFDHHGNEIQFPHKINSKTIENYPTKILQDNQENVKRPELDQEIAIEKLAARLKKPLEPDVRDLRDDLQIKEISEVYVPIFEGRLIGPKKKVAIIRIDAVRERVI